MRETTGIEEFKEQLARMDDPTLSLLDTLFRARGQAWLKLHALCQQARPAEGEPAPAWSRWEFEVGRRRQATFAKGLEALIRAESERRYEAARAAERARRDSITPQDAESLDDAELLVARAILTEALEALDSRWRLLARLGSCWPRGLRSSAWRKLGRIASGPEAIRAAAVAAIVSEARRRGLVEVASATTTPPEPDRPLSEETRRAEPKPARSGSRPGPRPVPESPSRRR
jgi:hypothetical protein